MNRQLSGYYPRARLSEIVTLTVNGSVSSVVNPRLAGCEIVAQAGKMRFIIWNARFNLAINECGVKLYVCGVNKVILIGGIRQDPEVRYMPNGKAANITVLLPPNPEGSTRPAASAALEWHRCCMYARLA